MVTTVIRCLIAIFFIFPVIEALSASAGTLFKLYWRLDYEIFGCTTKKRVSKNHRKIELESSQRADSTDSLKGSEVPPPVESVNQLHKACLKSRVVPRLSEPYVIGRKRKRSLLFSFNLID